MQPPKMKAETAIACTNESSGLISFYATPDAASDMSKFGAVESLFEPNKYWLWVDRRFSFAEVLAYIESYGK